MVMAVFEKRDDSATCVVGRNHPKLSDHVRAVGTIRECRLSTETHGEIQLWYFRTTHTKNTRQRNAVDKELHRQTGSMLQRFSLQAEVNRVMNLVVENLQTLGV